MNKPQPFTMNIEWKGYWGGPYIKARSVNDGETSQDGEWYRRAEVDKYNAELESLLRTTVDLLCDTDSLVLEQLTLDIACILPVEGIDHE